MEVENVIRPARQRTRLVFDVESELLDAVKERAKRDRCSVSDVCLNAVRLAIEPGFQQLETWAKGKNKRPHEVALAAIHEYLNPDLQFFSPGKGTREPLTDFLREAHEIQMLGATLPSLWEEDGLMELLQKKIGEDRTPMEFTIIDPCMEPGSLVFQVWDQRHRSRYRGQSLEHGLKQTIGELLKLQQVDLQQQDSPRLTVKVNHDSLIWCGITVVDAHDPERCRLRFKPYTEVDPNEAQPFFELRGTSKSGLQGIAVFLSHLRKVQRGTRLLDVASIAP